MILTEREKGFSGDFFFFLHFPSAPCHNNLSAPLPGTPAGCSHPGCQDQQGGGGVVDTESGGTSTGDSITHDGHSGLVAQKDIQFGDLMACDRNPLEAPLSRSSDYDHLLLP